MTENLQVTASEPETRVALLTGATSGIGFSTAVDEPPRVVALPPLALTKPRLGAWLRAVTLGELLGFTSTALIAFVALTLGGHPTTIRTKDG